MHRILYSQLHNGVGRLHGNLRLIRGHATKSPPSGLAVTQLPNGLTLAANPLPSHLASICLTMDAGSRYESITTRGSSHLLERLAFRSTKKRSGDSIAKALDKLGRQVSAMANRDSMTYSGIVFRYDLKELVDIFAETVTSPALTNEEFDDARQSIQLDLMALNGKPDMMLMELIHQASFKDNTLGLPLLCDAPRLASITPDIIQQYLAELYIPSRMVLSAVGPELHDMQEILKNNEFGEMPKITNTFSEENHIPRYEGGEIRTRESIVEAPMSPNRTPFTYVAMGFKAASFHDQDFFATALIQTLLGGGDAFSAGGPGKGMYSRLFQSVLNQYHYVESAKAFYFPYNDSGLFGIYGACDPSKADRFVYTLCFQLGRLASESVQPEEFTRAKNQLKSHLLMQLEPLMMQAEDIAKQVMVYKKRYTFQQICQRIDDLSELDVINAAKTILSSHVTLVVINDTFGKIPSRQGLMQAYFGRNV